MPLKTDATITGEALDLFISGNYLYRAGGVNSVYGVSIFDITSPLTPTEVGRFEDGDLPGRAIGVTGDVGIFPCGDSAGLVTLDLTDRTDPAVLGMDYDPVGDGEQRVLIVGTTAYVLYLNRFWTYDISSPDEPAKLDYVNLTGLGHGLAISGNYAYVVTRAGSGEAATLHVINISDPENISTTGTLALGHAGNGVALSGGYAFVVGGATLSVVNISNPASPSVTATLAVGTSYANDISISGNYAYIGTESEGLFLVDIEDQANPALIETLAFSDAVRRLIISGDYAYIGSIDNLYIVAISGVESHTITATAGAHGSISPSGAVSVDYGEDQAFTITADEGWRISNVLVDDVSVGAVASYTFEDVAESHTIYATFKGRHEEIRARVTKAMELRATVTKGTEIRAQAKKSTELRAAVRM